MPSNFHVCVLTTLFGCITYLNTIANAQVEIPIDKAVGILQTLEAEIKTLEWDVNITKTQIRDGQELATGFLRKSRVIYDPRKKIFCAFISGNSPASGRDGGNVAFEVGVSFDGVRYMAWRRAIEKEINSFTFGLGVVSKSESDVVQIYDVKRLAGMDFGIVTGLPSIFVNSYQKEASAVFLSEHIKKCKRDRIPCGIHEIASGLWQINTKGSFASLTFDVEILLDINKGGIVTKYEWSHTVNNTKHVLLSYEIQTIENVDGRWVPSVVTAMEHPGPGVSNKTVLTYSNVRIHEKTNANSFMSDFPDGIHVTDYDAKRYYKVGDPVSADKAIGDFMTRHNLTGNVPSQVRRGNVIRYILMGIGSIMIIIALYQMIQQKRRKS